MAIDTLATDRLAAELSRRGEMDRAMARSPGVGVCAWCWGFGWFARDGDEPRASDIYILLITLPPDALGEVATGHGRWYTYCEYCNPEGEPPEGLEYVRRQNQNREDDTRHSKPPN